MKKLLLSIIILLSLYEVKSQNMIYDGSFENYLYLPVMFSTDGYQTNPLDTMFGDILTNCLCHRANSIDMIYPINISKYSLCQGWFNAGYRSSHGISYATSDYFNKNVDPTSNFGFARYVDVPINFANSKDDSDNPLIPYVPAEAYDGKGYIGVFTKRQRTGQVAYTEIVAQTLDAVNSENYLREGGIYDISFRVRRTKNSYTTPHSLKKLSMFLWYQIPDDLYNSYRGIITNDMQKKYFMVNKHDNPSGFIDDTNWVLVHQRFTAPHDLNYVFFGSFDLYAGQKDIIINDSLITPIDDSSGIYKGLQVTYHYIDSVVIDSVGFIDTCDCGVLNSDIQFLSETMGKPGECCRVIFLKISNQTGNCRISEFMWDKVDTEFEFDTVNINDIGQLSLPNDIYYPVDTVCYDESLNNSAFTYTFKFRTFGSKEFRCQKDFNDTIDCYDLPCTWLRDSMPDPDYPSKLAVRLEIISNGINAEGQCCYDLVFINNSPYKINADLLNLNMSGSEFTRAPSNYDSVYIQNNSHQDWYSFDGFDAHSNFTLGTICIDQGVTAKLNWNISFLSELPNKFYCFEPRFEELSCGVCCPDIELFKTIVKDSINCCVIIDSLHQTCGDSVLYYKIENGDEVPIALPYQLCADNSDLKLRVKIYDHDTLYCVKNYDFSEIIENCSCCSNLFLDVRKDDTYTGSGCRFLINRIYGFGGCDLDSATTQIEYGKVVGGAYQYIGIMNYNDYDAWLYTMSNCEKDTLRFKFIADSSEVCSKDIIVQCQTCENLNINVIKEYIKTETFGDGPNETQIQFSSCCIDIEVQNLDSGSCDFYGIFYRNTPVLERINIYDNEENKLKSQKDTITICGATEEVTNGLTGTVSGTYAIYDANGNLVCSMHYEHTCEGFNPNWGKLAQSADIDMQQILVKDANLHLKLKPTKKLNYQLYNLRGQLIYREDNSNNEKTELEINTAGLVNGIYSVYIETDYGIIVRILKVVK